MEMEIEFDRVICLPDMGAWESFCANNADAIADEYETTANALRHALDGGLVMGGGAAPLTLIHFEA